MAEVEEKLSRIEVSFVTDLVEAVWKGPNFWPGYGERTIDFDLPGLYLFTFPYDDGYLIYAAGITKRPIAKRLSEHTRKYLNGEYTVLDIDAIKTWKRIEHWHGLQWLKYPQHLVREFETRKSEIVGLAKMQLSAYRLFVCHLQPDSRLLARFEAAIMNLLYIAKPPFCDIPDHGMMLAPRWEDESPIMVKNRCEYKLLCLPATMEI